MNGPLNSFLLNFLSAYLCTPQKAMSGAVETLSKSVAVGTARRTAVRTRSAKTQSESDRSGAPDPGSSIATRPKYITTQWGKRRDAR